MSSLKAKITGLTIEGDGFGEIESAQFKGKKVIIPNTIPGEVVSFFMEKDEKNISWGVLDEIKESSPHRIEPECPYFNECGGCKLQHIDIDFQREQKRLLVESSLKQKNKIEIEDEVKLLGSNLPTNNYRNRVGLHVGHDGSIGFYKNKSKEIVDICLLYTSDAADE